jgi:predicted nucleic acid-binding Zn ribbon protein
MAKQKLSKQQQDAKDRAENRRFMMIFVAATIVLVALMYYLMR